jgi:hypothetical protein
MLKGKKLYYVLGLGAVAYYFFYMNKKKKAMSTPSTAPANFTGDLDVTEYQNAVAGVRVVPRDQGTTAAQSAFASRNQNVPRWALKYR